MLPQSARLGLRRAHTILFSISYGPAEGGFGGSAVIVPKKVIKGAVARHQLKRRVRAILRPWSSKQQVIVVTAKTGSDTVTFSDIHDELSTAFTAILSST